MMELIMHWVNLIVQTFDWQLWIYQQWWAWAFLCIPAIVTTMASMAWVSLLMAPVYYAFAGPRIFFNLGKKVADASQKKEVKSE